MKRLLPPWPRDFCSELFSIPCVHRIPKSTAASNMMKEATEPKGWPFKKEKVKISPVFCEVTALMEAGASESKCWERECFYIGPWPAISLKGWWT